jgi:hypothetical protein
MAGPGAAVSREPERAEYADGACEPIVRPEGIGATIHVKQRRGGRSRPRGVLGEHNSGEPGMATVESGITRPAHRSGTGAPFEGG